MCSPGNCDSMAIVNLEVSPVVVDLACEKLQHTNFRGIFHICIVCCIMPLYVEYVFVVFSIFIFFLWCHIMLC